MLTTKSLFALFAIAAGGFLNAGNEMPANALPPHSIAAPPSGIRLGATPVAAGNAALQRASEAAVLGQIRHDLQDDEAIVHLAALGFNRVSNRSVEGRGAGIVLFDGSITLPIEFTVVFDLVDARIEHTSYLIVEAAQRLPATELGMKLRAAIADRIGARLAQEFSQQPVDFSLRDIDRMAQGRNRIVIAGNGLTRFSGEGAAVTRFVAVADKLSGRVISIQYELLPEQALISQEPLLAKLN